jgi:hypothetical protein
VLSRIVPNAIRERRWALIEAQENLDSLPYVGEGSVDMVFLRILAVGQVV